MRKTTRNEELAMVVLSQLYGDMLAVCRTTLADIDSDVKHSTFDTPDQLTLAERRTLEMQTTHHTV